VRRAATRHKAEKRTIPSRSGEGCVKVFFEGNYEFAPRLLEVVYEVVQA